MKAKEFLQLLEGKLEGLTIEEKNNIIFYYDELITGGIEEGLSEEMAVERLGNIDEIRIKLFEDSNSESNNLLVPTDLNFPKKLFLRSLDLYKKYKTINIHSEGSKVIVKESSDYNINVSSFNTIFRKCRVSETNDELHIHTKSKYKLIMVLLSIIIPALLVNIVAIFSGFDYNWNTIMFGIWIVALYSGLLCALYYGLKIENLTILLPKEFKPTVNINSKNGGIKCLNVNFTDLYAQTTSGNIKLFNTSIITANIKNNSGSIKCKTEDLDEPKIINSAKFLTYSGSIVSKNMKYDSLNSKNKSGSIKLKKTIVSGDADLSGVSGGIKLKESCVNKTMAKTISGSVKVKSSTIHDASSLVTTSGSVKVKKSNVDDLTGSVVSGSVVVKDSKIKNIEATTKSGSVILKRLLANRLDYNLELSTKSGVCRVLEIPKTNGYFIDKDSKESKIYSIKGHTNSGSVKVSFIK